MNYPFEYPASSLFAHFGATITIKIEIIHDKEANVFVATSKSILGLVLEAQTFDEITKVSKETIPTLLELNYPKLVTKQSIDLIFRNHLVIA